MDKLLFSILNEFPEGITEYNLFQELIRRGEWNKERISESYSLFQSHFLLFHSLYKMRKRLREIGDFDLEIHCLKICLLPYSVGKNSITTKFANDPLEDYYMNLDNYLTSPEEVNKIIEDFWNLFSKYQSRESALEVLGLTDPIDDEMILKKYRELIKEHHPDLGGDGKKISDIQRAKENLIR